jgi:hypothetical protein
VFERSDWAEHPTRRMGEWEGGEAANVTVILHESIEPGRGPRLHTHPYPETFIIDTDFEGEVRKEIGWREDDGWNVTYQAITPSWATYSGKRGNRIFYIRAIRMCGGEIIGEFDLEYAAADVAAYDPIVSRLAGSLRDSGTGWQC